MQNSYRLNAQQLDQQFLESLKTLFQDREIEILVRDINTTVDISKSKSKGVDFTAVNQICHQIRSLPVLDSRSCRLD